MVKLKIARVAAATAASAGLIAGFSGVASAHPHSYDNQGSKTFTNTATISKNNVGVSNTTNQDANSGDAKVISVGSNSHDSYRDSKDSSSMGNSGDATTGNASNSSNSSVGVTVANNTNGMAAGPSESDSSSNSLMVTNTKTVSVNDVKVKNTTNQDANSGDATVVGSDNSGDATTGNALNSSTSSVKVDVSN